MSIVILNCEKYELWVPDTEEEFGKGEWIVSTNSTTGIHNVLIFVKADIPKEVLYKFLEGEKK
jgi:hypothetical protein